MSERQFRRYVRQLKRHLGLVTGASRHSRQRRLLAPGQTYSGDKTAERLG